MAINSERTKLLPSRLQTTKINCSLETVAATLDRTRSIRVLSCSTTQLRLQHVAFSKDMMLEHLDWFLKKLIVFW